jgi:hypothetical protein
MVEPVLKILLSILLTFVSLGTCVARELNPVNSAQEGAGRYKALVKIIDRNTGFAHMTRGMNMNTINTLKNAVTQNDIPILRKMLEDGDRIVIMTSVNVLMDMGHDGRIAVYDTYDVTPNKSTINIISDHLTDLVLEKTSLVRDWKEDISFLRKLAENEKFQVAYTAIKLLAAMGEEGQRALKDIYYRTPNQRTKEIIKQRFNN